MAYQKTIALFLLLILISTGTSGFQEESTKDGQKKQGTFTTFLEALSDQPLPLLRRFCTLRV
jgi:hypothetical protein